MSTGLLPIAELPPLLPIPDVVGPHGGKGCSQGCVYCYNKNVARMLREVWQKNPLLIHTEASTHICWTQAIELHEPEQTRFDTYPWEHLIEHDIACATIEGDPGDPRQKGRFWSFLERASQVARLVFMLTKFPLTPAELERLAGYKNFRLAFSITGMGPPYEGVSIKKLVATFKLAQAAGVKAFPAIHPYVAFGVSNLDFLPEVAQYLSHPYVSIRGLHFDPEAMPEMLEHMPPAAREYYLAHVGRYELPDDGWSSKIQDAGLEVRPLGTWLLEEARSIRPGLTRQEAEARVRRIWPHTTLVGDLKPREFGAAAVERLM